MLTKELFTGVILLVLWAGTGSAEVELGYYDALETRFGTFSTIEAPDGFNNNIAFNGTPLPVEPVKYPSFLGQWSFDGADHAWVLANLSDGGNTCTTGATVIRADSDGAKIIGNTPSCEGLLQDVQLSEDEIQLQYFTDALRTEFTWYHFNENEMSETRGSLPFASDQSAGPGDDVVRWIGSHPLTALQELTERRRFLSVMSEKEIRNLGGAMVVANTVKKEGDWIYGKGCRPHLCGYEWGAWGIRISDGQPVAMLHSGDGDTRYFGDEGIKELKAWVESQK